jgi:hypothetical protein
VSVPAALHPLARARPLARSTRAWLLAALGFVFVLRVVLVWQRATPNYFPDEYLYASLGRSLAHFQAPSVRGQSAHFPALFQPLLTAPAWRAASLETGYRLVQAINAAALTLTAVPAWLLARRLDLSRGLALATAALALLVPDALYASFVLAEPLAYPLVLGAAAAGILAVGTGSRRAQLAFLVCAGLAAFARIQFAALPLCYLAAVGAACIHARCFRPLVRQQAVALGGLAVAVLAVLGAGASRIAGYYATALTHPNVHLGAAAREGAVNGLVFAYACGWIVVPGAALGIVLALARSRSRTELAFGAFALSLFTLLLVESAVFGATTLPQERYVFYGAPLAVIAFGLYASRGWPLRALHALLAVGLVIVAAQVPLSRWALAGLDDHSPFLLGVQEVERVLNGKAAGAGLVAGMAGALALAAIAASLLPRRGTMIAASLAVAFCASSYAAAAHFDTLNSRSERSLYLPASRSWVDAAQLGPATLVAAPAGRPVGAEEQLFWNRSLDRVAVLPGGSVPDPLRTEALAVAADGRLSSGGRPLTGPLVVDESATTVLFRDARREQDAPMFDLWRPRGTAQLAALMVGRYHDGLLAPRGMVELWPSSAHGRLAGWLELDVRATSKGPLALHIRGRDVHAHTRAVAGALVRVRVPVCSRRGPWTVGFVANAAEVRNGRPVAGSTGEPRFAPDPRACRGT